MLLRQNTEMLMKCQQAHDAVQSSVTVASRMTESDYSDDDDVDDTFV